MTDQIKFIVCGLLGIALLCMFFVMWLISFRLPDHLKSNSYKAIFISKVCWALLCGGGIYLILWPLRERVVAVTVIWFSLLAIGCIHSAIGFYLYSKDVNAVLQSEDFVAPLPAQVPSIDSEVHDTKDKREGGKKESTTVAPKT